MFTILLFLLVYIYSSLYATFTSALTCFILFTAVIQFCYLHSSLTMIAINEYFIVLYQVEFYCVEVPARTNEYLTSAYK